MSSCKIVWSNQLHLLACIFDISYNILLGVGKLLGARVGFSETMEELGGKKYIVFEMLFNMLFNTLETTA